MQVENITSSDSAMTWIKSRDVNLATPAGRCCRTLTLEDSHRESMRLDGMHEQADTRPLPHDELARLMSHCGAIGSSPMANASLKKRGSLLIWLDKDMTWLAPPAGSPGRPSFFSDAAIRFCLTIKGEGHPENNPVDCFQP